MLQARVAQVRGAGKIVYICSLPLAVVATEMRQWTLHFHLCDFVSLQMYFSCGRYEDERRSVYYSNVSNI